MRLLKKYYLFLFAIFYLFQGCDSETDITTGEVQLLSITTTDKELSIEGDVTDSISIQDDLTLIFSQELNPSSVQENIQLFLDETPIVTDVVLTLGNTTVSLRPANDLENNKTYTVKIGTGLQGVNGETFAGIEVQFKTSVSILQLNSLIINGINITTASQIIDVDYNTVEIEIIFSAPLDRATVNSSTISIAGKQTVTFAISFSDNDTHLTLNTTSPLIHLSKYSLNISAALKGLNEEFFAGLKKDIYTAIDPTPKLPLLPNDQDDDDDNTNDLLSVVQQQTFKYFYDFAEPISGMARERNSSGNLVTSGGSGFGIMALIVGMERNFITRTEGLARMDKILDFLETADRFHGAWSHWIDGTTGNVIPFSTNDNGGDLVETAFLVEGLITFRQYLDSGVAEESALINRINTLWEAVEWDWYRQNNQQVLYWHWSPDKAWVMNNQVKGWNECLITYVLAASAPEGNNIPKSVYTNGWASHGGMANGNSYYGFQLPLGSAYGGPLFFTHYSFLGLNPSNLGDTYADYWTQHVNHTLINHAYCVDNPRNFVGYSDECWGLTASDNQSGYSAHSPTNDLGVITPTAALSSFPYTPVESMKALKFFYYTLGDRTWGEYGFYDAFNVTENWYATSYLAIDQGPIVVMIENYRTGLLWNLFMSAPEVQNGLAELDFITTP